MSTSPERIGQGVEELRGDFLEMARAVATPAVAAGVAGTFPIFLDGRFASPAAYAGAGGRGDVGGELRRIQAIPAAAVAGAATNNVTINVRRVNAGAAAATLYTVTFAAGINWAAEIPQDLGIVNPTQYAPGDVVDVQVVQNGTGLALPYILWVIEGTRFGV